MKQEELKQRLIDVLQEYSRKPDAGLDGVYEWADDIADHLIANGVTIRERGEWLLIFNGSRCSVCGYENNACTVTRVRDDSRFCPNCGADMRGVKDE